MPSVSRPEYRCSGNIIVEVGGIKGEECGISVAMIVNEDWTAL